MKSTAARRGLLTRNENSVALITAALDDTTRWIEENGLKTKQAA